MKSAISHTTGWAILAIVALYCLASPAAVRGQSTAPDTVRLGQLYEAAERGDPRYDQIRLYEKISDLTLRSVSTGRRPQVDLSAEAAYQTETVSIPIDALDAATLPNGASLHFPTPPKDRYEVAAEIRQLLYDGGRIASEERIHHTRLFEQTAQIRSSLYGLRADVNQAFFAAVLQQEQRAQLDILADELRARQRLIRAQAQSGNALPSDEAAIAAELINVRQRMAAAEGVRRAALRRLELLTAQTVSPGDVLTVPDVEQEAAALVDDVLSLNATRLDFTGVSGRPELERFAAARARAAAEARAAETATRPQVTVFARIAAGRPGFDFFDDSIRPFGVFGLRARWPVWDWNATANRADAFTLQEEVITAEEAAFKVRLRRDVLSSVFTIEQLAALAAGDERAISLRERAERTALRQLEEGVLVAADYLEKRNDVFEARLQYRIHRVKLAEARVQLLTMLGVDMPAGTTGLREEVVPQIPFETYLIDEDRSDR